MKKYIAKLVQFVSERPKLKAHLLWYLNKFPTLKATLSVYKSNPENTLNNKCILQKGFGLKESEGVWSVSDEAIISFLRPQDTSTGLNIYIDGHFFRPDYVANILCNGNNIATWSAGSQQYYVEIPYAMYQNTECVSLAIYINGIKSPKELHMSEDSRTLGMFIKGIVINGEIKEMDFNFSEMTQAAKMVHELLVRKINMRNNKLCV